MNNTLRDVHELWNTGLPQEWDGIDTITAVEEALTDQAATNGYDVDADQIERDAEVIYEWLEDYRAR